MIVKVIDPSGKAKGYRMGLTFQPGEHDGKPAAIAYTEVPLNHGQLAGIGRWGYIAFDSATGKDVVAPLLAKHAEESGVTAETTIDTGKAGVAKGGK